MLFLPVGFILFLVVIVIYFLIRIYIIQGPTTNALSESLRNPSHRLYNILITGCSDGIGRFCAEEFYRHGMRVFMACRNEEKTRRVMQEIVNHCENFDLKGELHFLKLNLDEMESVKQIADEFLKSGYVLDVLINNAGSLLSEISFTSRKQPHVETMFQRNVLGHHLLTELLWNNLESNVNGARVVNVASNAHQFVSERDFIVVSQRSNSSPKQQLSLSQYVKEPRTRFLPNILSTFEVNKQYGLTKLCNIYQTHYFHEEKIKNNPKSKVTINCCHPGAIKSAFSTQFAGALPFILSKVFSLIEYLFFKDTKQGSQNTIHLAFSKQVAGISGQYFDDLKIARPSSAALNNTLYADYVKICNEMCQPFLY
ncbi:hypothetical protein C9374_001592 [Naegleria lovaniensis]|uniref:Uncharacterized protein n=1 Tax=Naegleria lovaniensis TaxID=51637 RepID=A0AA88GQY4_NAELO|nr:uncharacterized protein C9374_001592 [Naegleria lovaniensis]KAG2387260.1 hypothetical protein C9374_001592 [Naegleria lovaniensis]